MNCAIAESQLKPQIIPPSYAKNTRATVLFPGITPQFQYA